MLKLIFLFATLILLISPSNGCIKEGLLEGRSSGSIWKRDTIGISEGANLDPGIKELLTYKYTANTARLVKKFYSRSKRQHLFIKVIFTAIKKLERETFNLCEEDGEPGLTWDEVEQCEVSKFILIENYCRIRILTFDLSV